VRSARVGAWRIECVDKNALAQREPRVKEEVIIVERAAGFIAQKASKFGEQDVPREGIIFNIASRVSVACATMNMKGARHSSDVEPKCSGP
jgi:hypothetical protein